ncbi:MAG: response regulator [Eubacteriales bacterium]|nr:response regulator [Eubacteriales bacterium]
MKILLVDDQKVIVESIRKGIRWKELGINEVMAVNSAAEAKLLLVNMDIDLMLCDIEMPGEDGISLFQWTKEQKMNLCCIFLTAHADFKYAQRAIELGGFDYVLQPAKYSEIEEVLRRAVDQVSKNKTMSWLQETHRTLVEQRDIFLTAMITKMQQGEDGEAENTFAQLVRLLHLPAERMTAYTAVSYMKKQPGKIDTWELDLKLFMTRNVLEELLENRGKLCVCSGKEEFFYILLLVEPGAVDEEKWRQALERFYQFLVTRVAARGCIITGGGFEGAGSELPQKLFGAYRQEKREYNAALEGVCWIRTESGESEEEEGQSDGSRRMERVVAYIKSHVHQNISRTEAAGLVYLNEEYFSKAFKAYTGMTFKDYVLTEKMKTAMSLLANSSLSVGVIASKVGFDNFSHFSKTFKKVTDMTPQEYRKMHGSGA